MLTPPLNTKHKGRETLEFPFPCPVEHTKLPHMFGPIVEQICSTNSLALAGFVAGFDQHLLSSHVFKQSRDCEAMGKKWTTGTNLQLFQSCVIYSDILEVGF